MSDRRFVLAWMFAMGCGGGGGHGSPDASTIDGHPLDAPPDAPTSCTPVAEICDGVDQDCDGVADNGNPGGGQGCTTGEPGVCSAGTSTCTSGSVSCVRNTAPTSDAPDSAFVDSNCDGIDGDASDSIFVAKT